MLIEMHQLPLTNSIMQIDQHQTIKKQAKSKFSTKQQEVSLEGKWVLITGASGGIGRSLARAFWNQKANLVLTGRSKRKLLEIKNELVKLPSDCNLPSGWNSSDQFNSEFHKEPALQQNIQQTSRQKILCITADLADPNAPKKLYQILQNRDISIDILVNNAGVGDHNSFLESEYSRIQNILDVNILALTQLSWLFGQDMIQRQKGKILNIASVASYGPGPYLAVYYASKAYVLSFSLALFEELKNHNIQVCTVCPGRTKSGFDASAHMNRKQGLSIFSPADPDHLAQKSVSALLAGKSVVLDGALTYGMAAASHWLPGKQMAAMMEKINRPADQK